MPLAPGARLGPYEIVAPLGAGGMGEVYRARDSRLDRAVAVKLLPDLFATDPERMTRFEREARLLASLNHPNIAVIHGLEVDGGRRFIVMECVEGVSLAQRLAAGPLAVEEAVDVGRQVATALEAAHEGGVVHRDLKPGNVMLTPAGVAKVLDFGLAKGASGSPSDTGLSASPTMAYAVTGGGVILGTAAYMSPEQARGKPVDRRTDIWAFGCVLYESLTGTQAFEGETLSDLIASILKGTIGWDALPAETPPRVRELLRRCLERDPRQRLRDIGEARLILEQPMAGGGAVPAPAPAAVRGGPPAPLAVGGAIALAALAGLAAWALKPVPRPAPIWADLAPPAAMRFVIGGSGGHLALSSDGRWLAAVVADTAGVQRIAVRDFETGGTRLLGGTEEGIYPFWSPDGKSLGFFSQGRLMRCDVEGGALTALAPASEGRGGTWSRQGMIVFAPSTNGGLSAVSASGGDVRVLVPDTLRLGYRFPHFLPDGRHFVCAHFESVGVVSIETRALDGGDAHRLPLGRNVSGNVYFADGWLFYCQENALRARPFDPARGAFTGEAVTVASQVARSAPRGRADIAVASGGSILFRQGRVESLDQLVVRDRSGRVVTRIEFKGSIEDLQLAPDGRSIVVSQRMAGSGDVDLWTHDLERRTLVRLTFTGSNDDPAWSPDGARIAWAGPKGIRVKASSGAGGETVVFESPWDMLPSQWSWDGRSLLFTAFSGGNDAVWTLDLASGVARELLASGAGPVRHGQLSADGRWLAYAAVQANRFDIYVQDYPGLRGRWQVSARGGYAPRWRRDGRELYYLDADGRVQAVAVEVRDSSLTLGNPAALFNTEMGGHLANRTYAWDVDAAGSRFVSIEPLQREDDRPRATLVRNWRPPRSGRP